MIISDIFMFYYRRRRRRFFARSFRRAYPRAVANGRFVKHDEPVRPLRNPPPSAAGGARDFSASLRAYRAQRFGCEKRSPGPGNYEHETDDPPIDPFIRFASCALTHLALTRRARTYGTVLLLYSTLSGAASSTSVRLLGSTSHVCVCPPFVQRASTGAGARLVRGLLDGQISHKTHSSL